MAELLTVGEFSRLTHLTVKALRHYHDAGVLEPALVDPSTGYRYYTPEQVEVAQLVRRLREVRMPVAGVRQVVSAPDLPARESVIAAHLDVLRRELTATAAAVGSLRALLAGGDTAELIFRDTAEQHCLMIDGDVGQDDLTPWCAMAYPRLYAVAGRHGLVPRGPSGALYAFAWFQVGGRVTAFLPVAALPAADDGEQRAGILGEGVRWGILPAGRHAVAVHAGPCHDLDRTYAGLGRQVLAQGIGAPGPVREQYLVTSADTDDPDQLRTEVCWPVVAAG
ncbi:MerR family transcriptional regulator [Actinoplanes sp. SE50]|uniref:MerR family transcriptional regulator n=1 Tax=unclassified Actinoplanes TaxID=2626549 RepID=UPI00023EC2EA|nr:MULTISPECIES: MerR family transcriptional regulator [unclassified Actinoplanes]AEV85810.1 Multidrug-efflux transporter 1 regulator [Actinoplanes sp. SE50/110]ATO84204.1 MerR family transcriptional regulator [Actinoplanes sp. SE50]SLM01614.1 MerR-family transcriptional regulator [Actinoplanes sp. SE50/110]